MTPAWTTSEAIAERQGCSRTYLREMMDATPDTMTRPWVIKGTGKGRSARYSWEVARVDQWWREVHEWRAKSDAVIAGVSRGRQPFGDSEQFASRPAMRPREQSTWPMLIAH